MSNDAETRFLKTLQSIRGAGRFCVHGSIPFAFPGIRLRSGEELAFPLPPSQARAVRDVAEAAPYGMGAETRHDESVRRCWQIDAAGLEWTQPGWQRTVEALVKQIAGELGVEGKVSAMPYKLLLYEKGGFFLPHRDTEKEPGMFGSLIICLPSQHAGGALLVRHQGREERVEFGAAHDATQIHYAAFFADCEHEVLPVTEGFRLCLAYNLVSPRGSKTRAPSATANAPELLLPGLRAVAEASGNDLTAILLEHRYTEDGLSIAALKGDDRARAAALFETAERAGLTARLALVSLYQMGQLDEDYEDSYRSRRSRRGYREDSSAEGEMGEICEETLTIAHWRTPTDKRDDTGTFAISEDCILSLATLGEGEPDEKFAEGYTGNAGCTMEHWYRRAAIVVWPQDAGPAILARYNFSATCEKFREMAERKSGAAALAPFSAALLDEARRRLGDAADYQSAPVALAVHPLLHGIALSGSEEHLQHMLRPVFLPVFRLADRALWLALLRAFGDKPAVFFLRHTTPANLSSHVNALFHALDAALNAAPELARGMAARLPSWFVTGEKPDWRFRDESSVTPVHRWHLALAASCLVTAVADRTALENVLWSQGLLPHLREVLGPAFLEKSHRAWFAKSHSLAPALLTATVNTLAAECTRPLPPYPDWSRPVPVAALTAPRWQSGPLIMELLTFMTDPARGELRIRKPQAMRSAVEHFVRDHQFDLDMTTDKKGSPHTLVCRKNDASHQRSLKRRSDDETLLARLRGIEIVGKARTI